jgi:hypothetical protein
VCCHGRHIVMARDARERGAESAYMHPHTMRNVSFQGRHIVMARDARERGAESAYIRTCIHTQ